MSETQPETAVQPAPETPAQPAPRRRVRQQPAQSQPAQPAGRRQSAPAQPANDKSPSTNAQRSEAMNLMIFACAEVIATEASFKRFKSQLRKLVKTDAERAALDALTRDACNKMFAERLSYASSATRYDKRLAPQTRMQTRRLIAVA